VSGWKAAKWLQPGALRSVNQAAPTTTQVSLEEVCEQEYRVDIPIC